MHTCNTCGLDKPLDQFHNDARTQCKSCKKDTYLKRTYGITLKEYNQLFQDQDGSCAICGTHQCQTKKSFSVDHCHKTGKVRGLLCANCNTALGKFQDDEALLLRAISYLRKTD